MSTRSSGSDSSLDYDELLQIGTRCQELRKEKEILKNSQSQSFDLIRKLELHVKTLSEACLQDRKRVQELERELSNCSQEIDYLQDQLNARNGEVYNLGERVQSLELQLADTKSLEVGRLKRELDWSNSEHLILLQELESKELELQNSASLIEKLEESISSIGLEYQCEIETIKLDVTALEQRYFETKKFQEEAIQEKARMKESIEDLELQVQDAWKVAECLSNDNKELRKKLEISEMNARAFCQKIEEHFVGWLQSNDVPESDTQSCELEKDISSCGNILGPLLSRLAVVGGIDADCKYEMDKMSQKLRSYENLVKELEEELRAERSKAKEEAEDLAQEMAELRYEMTGLLEEERKRCACIEQISLQRIAELEAQIQKAERKSSGSLKLIQEE
ncbi:hypothetical protein NMG60_11004196 [Bertholletia excelsa]